MNESKYNSAKIGSTYSDRAVSSFSPKAQCSRPMLEIGGYRREQEAYFEVNLPVQLGLFFLSVHARRQSQTTFLLPSGILDVRILSLEGRVNVG